MSGPAYEKPSAFSSSRKRVVYKNGHKFLWLLILGMNGRPEQSGGYILIVWRDHWPAPEMLKP
jgi:hypothetical protein